MFDTIVVGYDGSDPSVRALETACELVGIHKAELHVVHTLEVIASEFIDRQDLNPQAEQTIADAKGIAAAMGVTLASTTIGNAQPCDDIMEIANLYSAKLIITGRRGLGSVSGLFMGSTSQKLAQTAKCACMTVA